MVSVAINGDGGQEYAHVLTFSILFLFSILFIFILLLVWDVSPERT